MSSAEGIPIRRLVINDPKDMPLHYGETPGGSIFSTTPGGKRRWRRSSKEKTRGLIWSAGSRIYYDRAFLLARRESPATRSPPSNLPFIPEGWYSHSCDSWNYSSILLVTLIPEPGTGETLVNSTNDKSGSMKKSNSIIDLFDIHLSLSSFRWWWSIFHGYVMNYPPEKQHPPSPSPTYTVHSGGCHVFFLFECD